MEIIQTRDPRVQAYSVVVDLLKHFGDIDQKHVRKIFESITQALAKREGNDSVKKIRIEVQCGIVGQNKGKVLIIKFKPWLHIDRLKRVNSELIDKFGEGKTLKFTHFVEALTKDARSLYFDIVFMVENPLFDPSIYLKILIFSFYYWRLYSTMGEEWTPDVLRGIGEFFDPLKNITLECVENDRFDLLKYLLGFREHREHSSTRTAGYSECYRCLGELPQGFLFFGPKERIKIKA